MPHTADSVVSYVMQTTESAPAPSLSPWTQWTPSLFGLGGIGLTLLVTWTAATVKRRQDTKKKLFLKVADAIHEAGVVLGSFSNMDTTPQALSARWAECVAQVNKAEVVAGNKLVRALIALKNRAGQAYGELLRIRMWAEPQLNNLRTNAPLIKQAQNEIDAILAEQKRMNIEGVNTPEANARFQRLQGFYTFFNGQLNGYFAADNASRAAIQPIIQKIIEAVSEHSREISKYRVNAVVLIRKELEFGWWFDEATYRKLQEETATIALKELELIFEEARKVWGLPEDGQPPQAQPPQSWAPHAG